MAYMEIENLYKNQTILLFKECYAMEKIHGTSAHITYKDGKVSFFAGGTKHENFVAIFDEEELSARFVEVGADPVVVYGEAYGGKTQKMRDTYGEALKFVVFEVKIGDCWLAVPKAEKVAEHLRLEFVGYSRVPTTLEALDSERDRPSVQATRNGCGEDKQREGVVLRPLEECTLNNGRRIIAKHKAEKFRETSTPRKVSEEELKVLVEAKAIADEWVTEMRLTHILDTADIGVAVGNIGKIIPLMYADIEKESSGEVELSALAHRHIGTNTALLVKRLVKQKLKQEA